jgi:hypothetical protein
VADFRHSKPLVNGGCPVVVFGPPLAPIIGNKLHGVAILFAIYPGFKQQPISVVYSNGLFLLASYIASFGFMFRALQTPKRYALYTALAITSYLACTLATEYYLGLDLLRPVFIWLMIGEDALSQKQRIQKTFWHWFPYLATLIVYLIWRVAIFQFPTYKPELVGELRHNPLSVFFYLMWRIVQDIYKSGWLAWTEPFRFPVSEDFTTTALHTFLGGGFYCPAADPGST